MIMWGKGGQPSTPSFRPIQKVVEVIEREDITRKPRGSTCYQALTVIFFSLFSLRGLFVESACGQDWDLTLDIVLTEIPGPRVRLSWDFSFTVKVDTTDQHLLILLQLLV